MDSADECGLGCRVWICTVSAGISWLEHHPVPSAADAKLLGHIRCPSFVAESMYPSFVDVDELTNRHRYTQAKSSLGRAGAGE